uniref:Uncharacterized protein n=1 Tax=Fagus sylvatica TaxID=28930 RepID=A0A2N9ITL5_FAGSY
MDAAQSEKAPIFGESLDPNRIASDAMDHPIRLIFRCFLGWIYGSKLSGTLVIPDGL